MNPLVNGTGKGDKNMSVRTYITEGTLTHPVSDYTAARDYLRSDDMTKYVDKDLAEIVHDISWDLTDDDSWKVVIITVRELTAEESKALSAWICGQNSDGLGEGFEQQPFAEHSLDCDYDDDDDRFTMSSFDWETNRCELTLVK